MKFIATFGQGQFGGALKDCCITFMDATEIQVRMWMTEHFKGKWSGCYFGEAAEDYLSRFEPTSIACIRFDEASDSQFSIDRYTVHTKRG